jgi:hypothetical protein
MGFYPFAEYDFMDLAVVPIKFLYARRTIAGQESVPQEECEVQMTNPQPNPQQNSPLSPAEPATTTTALRLVPSAEAQLNATLHDEIRLLRERGLSDECIHGLFSGFNIDARPEPASHRWTLPLNSQLIGLIWGKASSKPVTLD